MAFSTGTVSWNYGSPLEQVVVADGRQLWVYDPGLEQAVVRNQDEVLGDTPAGLLAGNTDPSLSYLVEALGNQEGIDWISIFPKEALTQHLPRYSLDLSPIR